MPHRPRRHPIRNALSLARNWVNRRGQFPWTLNNEINAVTNVLKSSQWNMGYGINLVHETLEREFAEYLGANEAVAVSSGGAALQIAFRALGIRHGDHVITPIDSCVANAFSIINAGGTPLFADCDPSGQTLNFLPALTAQTKAIVPVHLWGYPLKTQELREVARLRGITVIEDCCLALGAFGENAMVGGNAEIAIFSFGCVKPIQAGEGGMILVQDHNLAKEMRTIRSWGERMREYNDPDIKTLSWNGRMPEIIAAVTLEQLRGYPKLLREVRVNNEEFVQYLKAFDFVEPFKTFGLPCYNQFQLHVSSRAGFSRKQLSNALLQEGVGTNTANFEPTNRYSYFSKSHWKAWIPKEDEFVAQKNYSAAFPNAERIFDVTGLGISRNHFVTRRAFNQLKKSWDQAITRLKLGLAA